MKILLTGSTGLLGQYLLKTTPKKYQIYPIYNRNKIDNQKHLIMDITNKLMVKKIINQIQPNIIIHTASVGDIDYCEKNKRETYKVNVTGTNNLLNEAEKINAKFIFFSTNAVFDGNKNPYSEKNETNPINYYGKTKIIAENYVFKYIDNSIIFRLSTMYGWNDPLERINPATWLIKRLRNNQKTYIVNDVYNNHLWVGQAAQSVWKAIHNKLYGNIFHISGKDCINRYEFALKIADVFLLNKELIIPVQSSYFRKITQRAKNTCFNTEKMTKILKIEPLEIKTGLLLMKHQKYP